MNTLLVWRVYNLYSSDPFFCQETRGSGQRKHTWKLLERGMVKDRLEKGPAFSFRREGPKSVLQMLRILDGNDESL
jgi:hypothetical protein